MIRSHTAVPLQNFLLIGWLVLLPFKQIIKYKKPQYLLPGPGSFEEVTLQKVLPKLDKGNEQVPMLSFLTIPGVSPLSWAFVAAMIWYPKTCWFSSEVGLLWVWCRQGCSAPQDSPGFSALSFCNRNAMGWLCGFGSSNNFPCARCCTRRERCGGMIWLMHLWEISCRFVFCSYAGTCCLHFQYSLCILGRNKVKNLLSIALAPLSFRKAVRS